MNQLARLTTVIDAYVQARQTAGNPLVGQEEADFNWIAENLARADALRLKKKWLKFYFLYGQLLGGATAFIETYVPSEYRQ